MQRSPQKSLIYFLTIRESPSLIRFGRTLIGTIPPPPLPVVSLLETHLYISLINDNRSSRRTSRGWQGVAFNSYFRSTLPVCLNGTWRVWGAVEFTVSVFHWNFDDSSITLSQRWPRKHPSVLRLMSWIKLRHAKERHSSELIVLIITTSK